LKGALHFARSQQQRYGVPFYINDIFRSFGITNKNKGYSLLSKGADSEWNQNHPVTYSTVFLLLKLEESHGLFSVRSFVDPYCEAEWEPLRK